jgi:uncharacterized YigZ family protein
MPENRRTASPFLPDDQETGSIPVFPESLRCTIMKEKRKEPAMNVETEAVPYRTIRAEASAAFEIKKSRFLAKARPAETEEEARAFIAAAKKEYFDATHNCSAYILGQRGEKQKSNDDGEPGGTAGNPILETMKARELTQLVIVVTRYFGGIKLGAGGLIRAYSHAAALALEQADIVRMTPCRIIAITFAYPLLGSVENLLRQRGILTGERSFAADVTIPLYLSQDEEAPTLAALTELTAAKYQAEPRGSILLPLACS